ncbi:MAG: hypothetical protein PHQ59_04800 [Candidatus Daviesbacteria bacterium]|nr:hypothetical protein [Candidatus Daviesbacteria bacterium]
MNKKLSSSFFIFSMIAILVVTCGFFISLNFFVNPLQKQITALNYQPVTNKPVSLTLNLSNPDDNLLVFDPNLLIAGQSGSGTLILVTVNDNNQTLNASEKGDFSLTVKLQPGSNQIVVSAFDELGNYKSEERSIYYSEEKI